MTDRAIYPRILADVGGTNVRFAMETAPMRIGEITAYKVAEHASLEAAMRLYMLTRSGRPAAPCGHRPGQSGHRRPRQADQPQLGVLDRGHAPRAGSRHAGGHQRLHLAGAGAAVSARRQPGAGARGTAVATAPA
jgi:hypothetical protein